MRLTLLTDHRYKRHPNGELSSTANYNYSFFLERYLRVFDSVKVLARVEDDRVGRFSLGPSVEIVSLGNWTGPLQLFASQRRIRRVLSSHLDGSHAVIMIVPSAVSAIAYSMLKSRSVPYGVEVIGDPHDVFSRGAYRHPLRAVIQRTSVGMLRRQCSNAVASRYVTAAALQKRYPPSHGSFSIGCSNVVLPDAAFVAEPRRFTKKRSWSLIHIGTMTQAYKAQDVLLNAVAKCVSRRIDLELVFIGDGRNRSVYEKLARHLKLRGRTRFLGHLAAGDAIREQLNLADLFVLPSRTEGLPRALIEAMAQALPCIATNIGGIGELLPPEHLVEVNDSDLLSDRIIELLSSPQMLTRASARNLVTARRYHERKLAENRTRFYSAVREQCERAALNRTE